MSASQKFSFFGIAAWYALAAPFIAAGIIALGFSFGIPRHPSGSPASNAFDVAASVLLSSALASVLGLLGILKHGCRGLLWKSVTGLILSWLLLVALQFIGLLMVMGGQ